MEINKGQKKHQKIKLNQKQKIKETKIKNETEECKQQDGICSSQPSDVIRLTTVMSHTWRQTRMNGDCVPRL
jgi:hypothetical protein